MLVSHEHCYRGQFSVLTTWFSGPSEVGLPPTTHRVLDPVTAGLRCTRGPAPLPSPPLICSHAEELTPCWAPCGTTEERPQPDAAEGAKSEAAEGGKGGNGLGPETDLQTAECRQRVDVGQRGLSHRLATGAGRTKSWGSCVCRQWRPTGDVSTRGPGLPPMGLWTVGCGGQEGWSPAKS